MSPSDEMGEVVLQYQHTLIFQTFPSYEYAPLARPLTCLFEFEDEASSSTTKLPSMMASKSRGVGLSPWRANFRYPR